MTRKIRALVASAFLLSWMGGAQAGTVVLDANGNGPSGTPPFEFSFSSDASSFAGGLVAFGSYDLIAIEIRDGMDVVLEPLISFNPVESFLFSFAGGGSGDYTASVVGIGNGSFGLQIQAVPIPAAMVLFGSALALFGLVGRGRKALSAAA